MLRKTFFFNNKILFSSSMVLLKSPNHGHYWHHAISFFFYPVKLIRVYIPYISYKKVLKSTFAELTMEIIRKYLRENFLGLLKWKES